MTANFECVTRTSASARTMFELSLSIDAHLGSMSRSRERAIGGVTSGMIAEGQTVTWRAWHFGIPFRLTTLIVEVDAPNGFVDHQVRGPFASFRHSHRFEDADSGSVMTDHIVFTAPFGPLGRLAERLVLTRYLRRLILTRNAYLRTEAEAVP